MEICGEHDTDIVFENTCPACKLDDTIKELEALLEEKEEEILELKR